MNAALTKALAMLMPASMLLSGSAIVFAERKTLPSFLQLFGAACLTMVPLTHTCEALQLLPSMRWGLPDNVGHYLDLGGAAPGVTLFPLRYMWQALTKRKDLSAGCREGRPRARPFCASIGG